MCQHGKNLNNLGTIRENGDIVTYCKVCGVELGRFAMPKRWIGLTLGNAIESIKPDKAAQKWAKSKKIK